ncbi:MAG: hypothetical protein LIO56_06975 [Lachnospiraceae bacterium]|nr:hypothetical protein [Lachnospiraceae bacterium]
MYLWINLFEALMIICFGISWPISIYKSVKSRTAKGKSLSFELFVWVGYIFGITRKILQISAGTGLDWLFYLGLIFYLLNIVEITIDIALYFRNRKLDMQRDASVPAE